MRPTPLLALLSLAATIPAAAQAVVVPVRCHGECPPPERMPYRLALDSVLVSAHLEKGVATTWVHQMVRNETAGVVDGAFFFPLPPGATVERVVVYDGTEVEQYNEWSGPEESRWILEGIARDRRDAGLGGYAGENVVHVRVPSIPPRGSLRVQLSYTQPLRGEGEALGYRYPLAVGAAAAPPGQLRLIVEVETEHGFRGLASPSHEVNVRWGEEAGRCHPRARCGTTNVPSRRIKVVTLEGGREIRQRDFELVYTPSSADSAPRTVSIPERRR